MLVHLKIFSQFTYFECKSQVSHKTHVACEKRWKKENVLSGKKVLNKKRQNKNKILSSSLWLKASIG